MKRYNKYINVTDCHQTDKIKMMIVCQFDCNILMQLYYIVSTTYTHISITALVTHFPPLMSSPF